MRELREETGWVLAIGDREVFIVTYGCHAAHAPAPVHSVEHHEAGLFTPAEVEGLPMPDGYMRSVAAWCQRCATAKER